MTLKKLAVNLEKRQDDSNCMHHNVIISSNLKTKRRRKSTIVANVPQAGVTNVSIFSSKR